MAKTINVSTPDYGVLHKIPAKDLYDPAIDVSEIKALCGEPVTGKWHKTDCADGICQRCLTLFLVGTEPRPKRKRKRIAQLAMRPAPHVPQYRLDQLSSWGEFPIDLPDDVVARIFAGMPADFDRERYPAYA